MAWISENRALTQAEMENNADIIIAYYRSINYDDKTISAILGNMQAESSLSPIRQEVGGVGYGLVQWTPPEKLQNHCNTLGLTPYTSGDVQIQVVDKEMGTADVNQWYTTRPFINNYSSSGATSDMINITPTQFKTNSMDFSVEKLTILFMAGYERPSTNPNVNHIDRRKTYSNNWWNYISGSPVPPTPPPTPTPVPLPDRKATGKIFVVKRR